LIINESIELLNAGYFVAHNRQLIWHNVYINHRNQGSMKTGKALLVIAGAASAGIIIGMLIAREKGSTLRKSIKKSLKEQGEKFVCDLGDVLQKVVARFEGVKNTISDQLSGLEISKGKIHYN
jgi:hypothetical protein